MSRDSLQELHDALASVEKNLAYGTEDLVGIEVWDYIIFGRDTLQINGTSGRDYSDVYFVMIVRENYVPNELIQEVISKVTEIPGFRIVSGDHQFDYARIGNTKAVAESITLKFAKANKNYAVYKK